MLWVFYFHEYVYWVIFLWASTNYFLPFLFFLWVVLSIWMKLLTIGMPFIFKHLIPLFWHCTYINVLSICHAFIFKKYLLEQRAIIDVDGGKLLNEDNDIRSVSMEFSSWGFKLICPQLMLFIYTVGIWSHVPAGSSLLTGWCLWIYINEICCCRTG